MILGKRCITLYEFINAGVSGTQYTAGPLVSQARAVTMIYGASQIK